MQNFQPAAPPPIDLPVHIAQVLAEHARPPDPALLQRLLRQLQRVEPAARTVLAQAAAEPAESFDACLHELR